MNSILNIYKNLFYSCFDIKMCATEAVRFDAWPGAILRNNLLFAAEQIRIQKTGRSLREQIDTFSLNDNHSLYKELKEGFPKGYVLTDFSHTNLLEPSIAIRKDEIFSFSLLLIGHFNDYRFYFFEAIREMCERGIGKPMTPFQLMDITESPSSPVTLSDFLQPEITDGFSELTVHFLTPTILYRLKGKKNTQLSYQDKTNRFPGLYQLVRSACSRLQKLHTLYIKLDMMCVKLDTMCIKQDILTGKSDAGLASLVEDTPMETFLEKAGRPLLKSANIQHISLPNTQKKEKPNEIPLSGYIGEQKYTGYFQQYLPLLKFMEKLGVGNETVYGMGRYEIEKIDN